MMSTPTILMPDTDILAYDGGAVKALDGKGAVGGHLILWGDADSHDATTWRDYFTPQTDLGRFVKTGAVDLIFHHDLPVIGKGKDGKPLANPLAGRDLGEVKAKPDDVGLWVEGVLAIRDEYERQIHEMVKAGKISWSSGAVSHRVRREKQANGAHEIKRWHVVEASLTPTPGEHRTAAIALKTLMEEATGDSSTATSVFFPASDAIKESSDRSDVGPATTFVDDWADLGSRRVQRAAELKKLSTAKRKAIEEFLEALQSDRREFQAELSKYDEVEKSAVAMLAGFDRHDEPAGDDGETPASPAESEASPAAPEAPAADADPTLNDDAVLRDADAALAEAAEVLAG